MKNNRQQGITDEEFQIALDNIDNKKVINKVRSRFARCLSFDELKQCGLEGLWRALKSHDTTYGRKFTSSLYQFVEWECQRAINKLNHTHATCEALMVDIPVEDTQLQHGVLLRDLLEYLDNTSRNIIVDRYIYNYTLKEIAAKYGYTSSGVKYIIKKTLKQLRKIAVGV